MQPEVNPIEVSGSDIEEGTVQNVIKVRCASCRTDSADGQDHHRGHDSQAPRMAGGVGWRVWWADWRSRQRAATLKIASLRKADSTSLHLGAVAFVHRFGSSLNTHASVYVMGIMAFYGY